MIEDEYDRWEQKKRDVMYHIATGQRERAEQKLQELVEHTIIHWREIRLAADEPVVPDEGQVVDTKTL